MVSVVIPCFRCKETIERALDSIARQTVVPSEVILVDDSSGDGTYERLVEISAKYVPGWIKVLALPTNEGPGSARNAGWNLASGRYIAFLDADDSWHPQKIEKQLDWMERHPEIALTGHRVMELKAVPASFSLIELLQVESVSGKALLFKNRFPTRSVMLRRDLKARFLPGKRHSEDFLLWLSIVLSGEKAVTFSEVMAFSFKADFGSAGLSSQLWKHEVGELSSFAQLRREGLIGSFAFCSAATFSLLKFLRRALVVALANTKEQK